MRLDRGHARELDAADPLQAWRERFVLPHDDAGRELVYLCAAWMAMADSIEQSEETQLLVRMREKLAIGAERAGWLMARAVDLRKKQALERASWWRAFDRLVVEAARALPRSG